MAAYFWRFEIDQKIAAARATGTVPSAAVALSKDLKKRGWNFVGPTTVYAFMQAVGLVNDHAKGCVIAIDAMKRRQRFKPPT